MALAAKLLVGALVLGAGSTATYVAVTGGFGAGGNGTETEASGETQAVASPAPSSSGPQTNPVAGQGQNQHSVPGTSAVTQVPNSVTGQDHQSAPAGDSVDLSLGTDAEGTGLRVNDQVPDVNVADQSHNANDAEGRQGKSDVAVDGGTTGQEETGSSQTPEASSSQSLPASSTGNANKNGQPQGVDGGRVVDAVGSTERVTIGGDGNTDSGQGAEVSDGHNSPANTAGQKSEDQTANTQTEGQAPQGESGSGQGVTSPSAGTVTEQEPGTHGGDSSGINPGASGSGPNSQETNPTPSN